MIPELTVAAIAAVMLALLAWHDRRVQARRRKEADRK